MRRILALTLISLTALSTGIASASSGSLTSYEYQQIQSLKNRLKSIKPTTLSGYRSMLWACEQIQMRSPLLVDERKICDDYAQMNIRGIEMRGGTESCVARTHTEPARLICLGNLFARWAPSIRGFDNAEVAALHIATARGFSSQCTAYLAGSPEQLMYSRRLVADAQLIIAAARGGSITGFEADDGVFITDAARLQGAMNAAGPTKISVCGHQ